MNPFSLLAITYLIGRYLRSSGDPSCERAGEQMEEDVEDVVGGAWQMLSGCIVGACLIVIAIGVIVLALRAIGWLFGL